MTLKHRLTMLRPMIKAGMNGRTVQLPPKIASPHYLTPQHVQWSQEVRKRAGYQCEKCGRQDGRMFADHVIELKDGGNPFDPANGQCLCQSCHGLKTVKERKKRLGII